jgi:alkanesulfonate monooxygenase SsuD/methylene tetrahydromethanopterin reductase-like flavin-dependent oxidoreductase (luciferase family)
VVEQARAEAGRSGHHEIVVYVLAGTGVDARARCEAEARAWGLDLEQDMLLVGTAGAVAAGVRGWAEAGADRVILQPTGDEPDPEGFVRWVGTEVAPLLG